MSTDPNSSLDSALDPDGDAGVAPEYAGSADEGVVSSVPEHDPMAGDAEGVVRAELAKLFDLYGDIVALLDNGELDEVGQRWFGRHPRDAGVPGGADRVVVPEVPDAAGRCRSRPAAVMVERLPAFDELNADRARRGPRHRHRDRRVSRGPGAVSSCRPWGRSRATSAIGSARTCARSWWNPVKLLCTGLTSEAVEGASHV